MGEEKTRPVELLENWEGRTIPTLFLLQTQYAGVKYSKAMYTAIAEQWILDIASFLGKYNCITRELKKEAIKYIKDGNFEDEFEDVLVKGYIEKHGTGSPRLWEVGAGPMRVPRPGQKKAVWSAALSDAINKFRSVVNGGFDHENDIYTIKSHIERALHFYSREIPREKKEQFRHKMLLTVIKAMRAYR